MTVSVNRSANGDGAELIVEKSETRILLSPGQCKALAEDLYVAAQKPQPTALDYWQGMLFAGLVLISVLAAAFLFLLGGEYGAKAPITTAITILAIAIPAGFFVYDRVQTVKNFLITAAGFIVAAGVQSYSILS